MSETTWLRLRKNLQEELSSDEFRTWIRPLKVESETGERLVLEAPNDRFVHTLEQSYRPLVDRAIAGLEAPGFEVLFSAPDVQETRPLPGSSPQEAGTSPRAETTTGAKAPTVSSSAEPAVRLDGRYRFDSFVVGSSNQLASAAAEAVALAPGERFNPLFLYGGVGLGKTHLLHAIAQEMLDRNPSARVLYLSAEDFVNELIHSIRFDKMTSFRARFRTLDALLVDDVQFLANKERTQEEFFHTFNALYTRKRQIILSSDSSPGHLVTLEERLRSRFGWGLIADIQPPELETKIAILERKATEHDVELPSDVALFVARAAGSNIRELEGLLNRLLAYASLTSQPLDIGLVEETLKEIVPGYGRQPQASDIIKRVAAFYGLKVPEIKSRNNSRQVAFPRQVAMYLCKRLTSLSYPEIGKRFRDKHHSTVMYSVEKITKLRDSDKSLDEQLDQLERELS